MLPEHFCLVRVSFWIFIKLHVWILFWILSWILLWILSWILSRILSWILSWILSTLTGFLTLLFGNLPVRISESCETTLSVVVDPDHLCNVWEMHLRKRPIRHLQLSWSTWTQSLTLAQQLSICLTLIYLSRGRDYLVLITEYYWPSSNSRVRMDRGMNDGKQLWAPEPAGSFFLRWPHCFSLGS